MPAGRKSGAKALGLWSNGERVGTWQLPSRGEMAVQYDSAWARSQQARPLSLSLPLTVGNAPLKGQAVQNYFDNLLPDSQDIRQRLASRFRAGSAGVFDLLQAIGRDCVGAVQLLPEDEAPTGFDQIESEALTDARVEALLAGVTSRPVPGARGDEEQDLRISLAGAQEKTALLWHANRWCKPRGATPTTHIFKLPLGFLGPQRVDFSTSVQNEWICLRLLKAFGLPVANARALRFDEQEVLCVERFDRKLHSSGNWWMRLPQEDFCQALGVAPGDKYEAEGGPGVAAIAGLLGRSEDGAKDMRTLLAAQILFWMLAAPDGHAKNFSIHLLAGGRFRLAPLYDVMSIWPTEGNGPNQWSWHKTKLAMAVEGKNRHYRLRDVRRRHFNAMAARIGYGADAEDIIEALLARTAPAIDQVAAELPADFSPRVAEAIFKGLRWSADALGQMERE